MPRSLSTDLINAMQAGQTGFLVLQTLIIEHDDLATPIYLVNNSESITRLIDGSRKTFLPIGFDISLPEEREDGLSEARVTLNNADLMLIPTIRSLSGIFTITYEIVSASIESADPPQFDNVEIAFLPFQLSEIQYNETVMKATLTYENTLGLAFPVLKFNPYDFSGLY